MSQNKTEYNKTIAPLWESDYGGYYSMVNDKVFDEFQALEKGGMLVIRKLKEESRKKENSPHAYLEFITPAQLAAKRKGGKGGTSKSNDNEL